MEQRFQFMRGDITVTAELDAGELRLAMHKIDGDFVRMAIDPREARALADNLKHLVKAMKADG